MPGSVYKEDMTKSEKYKQILTDAGLGQYAGIEDYLAATNPAEMAKLDEYMKAYADGWDIGGSVLPGTKGWGKQGLADILGRNNALWTASKTEAQAKATPKGSTLSDGSANPNYDPSHVNYDKNTGEKTYGPGGQGSPHYGNEGYVPNGDKDWVKAGTDTSLPAGSQAERDALQQQISNAGKVPDIDFAKYVNNSAIVDYYAGVLKSTQGDINKAADEAGTAEMDKLSRAGVLGDEAGAGAYAKRVAIPRMEALSKAATEVGTQKAQYVLGLAEKDRNLGIAESKDALAQKINWWLSNRKLNDEEKRYYQTEYNRLTGEANDARTKANAADTQFMFDLAGLILKIGGTGGDVAGKIAAGVTKGATGKP